MTRTDIAFKFLSSMLPLYAHSPHALLLRAALCKAIEARPTGISTADLFKETEFQDIADKLARESITDFLSSVGDYIACSVTLTVSVSTSYSNGVLVGSVTAYNTVTLDKFHHLNFVIAPTFQGDLAEMYFVYDGVRTDISYQS